MKQRDIIKVTWIDASVSNSWHSAAEEELDSDVLITSVGFLIAKRKDVVVLAACLGEDDDVNGVVRIPVPWIKNIKKIGE